MDGTMIESGERQAWRVRKPSREYSQLGSNFKEKIAPLLAQVPVPLGEIAKELGVRVKLSTLPRGVSGQIGKDSEGFIIKINRHEAKGRQRFTLAHELSHFLLHKDTIEEEGELRDNVLLRSGLPEEIEFQANRLASDLVIPSDALHEEVARINGPITEEAIDDLARRFGVSVAAMEIKLGVV